MWFVLLFGSRTLGGIAVVSTAGWLHLAVRSPFILDSIESA